MAEVITMLLFVAGLLICIVTGADIIYALFFGLICFVGYSLYKKHRFGEVAAMMKEGVLNAKTVLIFFAFIGMLTAVWRCSGTIPYIIYNAVGLIEPKFVVLSTFLLCCLMSVLTGTSFGTAGTMGVICMMTARSLGADPLLTGGAVLAGSFFGDRCSPMSSSAAMVCELTKTDIYKNIANMVKTSVVPFVLSCLFYLLFGSSAAGEADVLSTVSMFAEGFRLSAATVIPAVLIVVLLMLRANVKLAMLASIIAACAVSVTVQGMGAAELFGALVFGYTAPDSSLGALINGGGLYSMVRLSLIIVISSAYAGIFKHTDLLLGVKTLVKRWAAVITPFGAVTVISVFLSMISCNQTLATMLACQMAQEVIEDKYELAVTLENTAIVIAPLIPWSIAAAVPMTMVGAPLAGIAAAVYLYLVPLCNLIPAIYKSRR